jgi:hypothetical protein
VSSDGAIGNPEHPRNFLIAQSARQQAGNFPFARRKQRMQLLLRFSHWGHHPSLEKRVTATSE